MHRLRLQILAAGATLIALAGFAAHAAIEPRVPFDVAREAAPNVPASLATDFDAAPAQGTTGSVALPAMPEGSDAPLPMPAAFDRSTVPAAPPFRLRGSYVDQSRALQCLTTAIYYEAASEPEDGQRAVAQVVLNRVRHRAFPATVCGVVFQGSDRKGCQFSFACDGAMARRPMQSAWNRAQRVAAAALNGDVFAPVGFATHYHTYAVTPSWNRSLVMTGVHGAHFFHRWKGWWGTAAAFADRHMGNEPLPGPLAPAQPPAAGTPPIEPTALPQVTLAATAPQPRAPVPPAAVQPAYADAGTPLAVATAVSEESQILDRWKDAGKPIR
ncbi:cell wall hydrolase [Sphingomonas baiyangensis]|uniref:Cell wall hydrolase n=1 Tax=Sphingomonas baiyangensis TaxID=2572576 RepID=A0A4U1L304_9SPHN|nr:cell wall hydrolase [Sphingomonas baiyangensis]TKD51281.1 cell wall hydrolase [Sphingomonas baiyangensis]